MMNSWQYSTTHNCLCKVIEVEHLWQRDICRVWLPTQDVVVRVLKSDLRDINDDLQIDIEANRIHYISAAAKIAELLEKSDTDKTQPTLLAPIESNVVPMPHQIHALTRAISGDRIRYLLADEVGLGKTIEAGLIMRELKLRGLARRTLIVTPKGLAFQWSTEMKNHFNENFHTIMPDDIKTVQKLVRQQNHFDSAWTLFNQVIVTLDSIKPVEKRQNWSDDRIKQYNRDRFEEIISVGWDLIIVDEAHRLGGSTEQVARYKLGQGLSEAAPYLLLLSATPHQGKTDAFFRLMNLLDDKAFPDETSVTPQSVSDYVIRTEKRKAITDEGKPLFQPRQTQTLPVQWLDKHKLQKQLYDEVTEYARKGYNQAMKEKKQYIGFLMILMQRLVVSSTAAIRNTLQRRQEALQYERESSKQKIEDLSNPDLFKMLYDMDAEDQLEEVLTNQISYIKDEEVLVRKLLQKAQICEQAETDAKAETLAEQIHALQTEENDSDVKLLIFTEFISTQKMLQEFLENRGFSVVVLNGSMDTSERLDVQKKFNDSHRILISTDAGGEGLNLQCAHVVINYDLPWNPMRLEQRIGRVDRIGQTKRVKAINFVFEGSVEFRVREVLEHKLSVILNDFGIDKTGDVLDSAQAGELFESVFTEAMLNPDEIENSIDKALSKVKNEIETAREVSPIYDISEEPDPKNAARLRSHPLPFWLEKMTVSYLQSQGGKASHSNDSWKITWPDGEKQEKCFFSAKAKEISDDAVLLNLENNRIRGLAMNLPQSAMGQPIPQATIDGLNQNIKGLWGLFEVRLQAGNISHQDIHIPSLRRAYFNVFLDDDKLLAPTARHIWDSLQAKTLEITGFLSQEASEELREKMLEAAKEVGQEVFEALHQKHLQAIATEEKRGETAFGSRRKAIDKVGLAEVKQYRLDLCDKEQKLWHETLKSAKHIIPEVRPLVIAEVTNR